MSTSNFDFMLTDDLPAIAAKAREALTGSRIELVYVGRNDGFTPRQVTTLLRGENPFESKDFSDFEEWMDDSSYSAAVDYIKDVLTEGEYAAIEGSDDFDNLRQWVQERDTSDPIKDVLRGSGSMLVRYDLDCQIDTDWSSGEEDVADQAESILNALGLPPEHPLRERIVGELLPNASYGGGLWALWYADVEDLERDARPYQAERHGDGAAKGTITFDGVHLLVLDKFNGSGHDMKIDTSFTVDFDPTRLTTDRGEGGYSWDEIAGVYAPAYKVTVAIRDEATEATSP